MFLEFGFRSSFSFKSLFVSLIIPLSQCHLICVRYLCSLPRLSHLNLLSLGAVLSQ